MERPRQPSSAEGNFGGLCCEETVIVAIQAIDADRKMPYGLLYCSFSLDQRQNS
jgi:hypothetical protein